jgi:anti-sigma factor RsiW
VKLLTCAAVRRRLASFHDGELGIEDQIAVAAHLEGCPPCAGEARGLRELGDALRWGAAAQAPADGLTDGLRSGVVSRWLAEHAQSLGTQVGRMFEDMHLVWAGLSATAATVTCAVALFGIAYLTPPERPDSLAGVVSALAAPGSNRNPVALNDRIRVPRVVRDAPMRAVLASTPPQEEDLVFALAAVVTQEGRLTHPEVLLSNRQDREAVVRLMNAIIDARFEPASYRGAPVAVNLVWLLTHTTVRAKAHS